VTAAGTPQGSRRKAVRRHRRERQVLVFGLLTIGIAAVTFIAMGIYNGTITGPFNATFVTPQADFTSSITVACPPAGSLPLKTEEVAVRVLNGTDQDGLASTTLEDLVGRGFVGLGATNWSQTYPNTARIMFGETGVQKAYTLALQFPEAEMVLDTRTNATVDVVLGAKFKSHAQLVDQLDPQLDPTVPLTANVPCLPVTQVEPEPAPRIYPKDPLAPESPTPTPSPSTSPSA
jgi:hypothetical protein